jgi:DNA (cytosine-5)-methyltransferase 1
VEAEPRPIGIDLFCGAGGMSLGFEQAGFDVVAAVDHDPVHVATYALNFPACATLQADLSCISGQELRDRTGLSDRRIDVVFGGPPCGGFSMIGRRRTDDPRNDLLLHFARLVDELRPSSFVVENVEGLLKGPARFVLDTFVSRVDRAGYSVVTPIVSLDASDFGVPQGRRRVFVVGAEARSWTFSYPRVTPRPNGAARQTTVWDAIGDLPNVDERDELFASDTYYGELGKARSRYARILRGEVADPEDRSLRQREPRDGLSGCLRTAHKAATVRRFAATKPGSYEPTSRFYRLPLDGLCPTLRAGSERDRGSFTAPRPIHPLQPRCITVREGARLQSFPDWMDFHPTKWHGFRQVGNAVPPLLARAVAAAVREAVPQDSET